MNLLEGHVIACFIFNSPDNAIISPHADLEHDSPDILMHLKLKTKENTQ